MYIYIYTHVHRYGRIYIYIYTFFYDFFLGIRYICIYNYIVQWLARTVENKCVFWTWDRKVSYTSSIYIYTYVGACFSSYCWHLKQIKGFFLSMWFESKNPVHETIPYVSQLSFSTSLNLMVWFVLRCICHMIANLRCCFARKKPWPFQICPHPEPSTPVAVLTQSVHVRGVPFFLRFRWLVTLRYDAPKLFASRILVLFGVLDTAWY